MRKCRLKSEKHTTVLVFKIINTLTQARHDMAHTLNSKIYIHYRSIMGDIRV